MSDFTAYLRDLQQRIGILFFAVLVSLSHVSLQSLFLAKISEVSELPKASFFLILSLFLLSGSVAGYLFEAKEIREPRRWLRISLIVLVITVAIAYFALTMSALKTWSPLLVLALASLSLSFPALASGALFGFFFHALAGKRPRMISPALVATALGSIVASFKVRQLTVAFGFSSMIVTLLLGLLTLALLLSILVPVETENANAASDF